MKKLGVLLLAVVLILALAACRKRNNTPETTPTVATTVPTTVPETTPVLPETMPTLETNIPDPNVDSSMPGMNDGTDTTENTGNGDDGAINSQNPEMGADSRMRRGQ